MTIGFIGAGNMARAMISGLLAKKAVAPTDIVLHGGQPLHYEPYAAKIGAKALASNQAVAETADIVFLAVSPKLGEPILQAIGSTLKKRHVPVVSMLTGVSVATLEEALGSHDQPVLRIMPNVNVAINAGMIAYAANDAGVKYGLEKDQATAIAAQAVMGSAKNVLASDQSPFDLIDQVSSPGGTTVAGLLAMEEAGLMTAVVKGVDATIAKDRHG